MPGVTKQFFKHANCIIYQLIMHIQGITRDHAICAIYTPGQQVNRYPNAMATGMVYFGYMQNFLISSVICPASVSRPIAIDNNVLYVIARDSDFRQNLITRPKLHLDLVLYSGYCPHLWGIRYTYTLVTAQPQELKHYEVVQYRLLRIMVLFWKRFQTKGSSVAHSPY